MSGKVSYRSEMGSWRMEGACLCCWCPGGAEDVGVPDLLTQWRPGAEGPAFHMSGQDDGAAGHGPELGGRHGGYRENC